MKIQKRIMVLRTIEVDDADPAFCASTCPLRGTEDCPRVETDLQEDLFGSGKEYRGKDCEKEFGLGPEKWKRGYCHDGETRRAGLRTD